MRKLIASTNITLDRFCDHNAVIADEELHENANELLRSADTILLCNLPAYGKWVAAHCKKIYRHQICR